MKLIITTAFTAVVMLFFACTSNQSSDKKEIADYKAVPDFATTEKPNDKADNFFSADSAGPQEPPNAKKQKQPVADHQSAPDPDWDKKIIKTASLNLEVKDYDVYYKSIREKIKSLGGYTAQEEQNLSDYKTENSLVIKVPVDQFDDAVTLLSAGVIKINEKKISSQDVTAEYVDTRSRMEAKKQFRQRYMDLLKQAKNMEEILNVQGEINGIQEQIEAAAGQIEYLGHASAFSTINLTYYQVINATAKADQTPSFGTKLAQSFKAGGSWVLDLLVGLVSIWPLFLFAFAIFLGYRKLRTPRISNR
jgi:hypothetical protein